MLADETPMTRCLSDCLETSNEIAIAISSDSRITMSDLICN
ncbi:hypothetical protein BVRB_3g053420 isoform A [Beta vulgaris subsp. vulgaris]|nr:hypothetical protein BVRB_3g053420 isoform A [Beta vulgaris subsp. vulgaris]